MCIFNSINVYVPYSIDDYIWANLNFQKKKKKKKKSCNIAVSFIFHSLMSKSQTSDLGRVTMEITNHWFKSD